MNHRNQRSPAILQHLRELMPVLRERYQVRSLALFGSYARGEARRASDLDLLVEFERAPGLVQFIELEQYLSDELGIKVDLVMRSALKPVIGRRILDEALAV